MSWNVSLEKDGKVVQVQSHTEGGAYAVGGTTEAELNATYNYAKHFYFPDLDSRQAAMTLIDLSRAIQEYGTEQDPNYWEPTPGNVGHACLILLQWASQNPDAIWRVR